MTIEKLSFECLKCGERLQYERERLFCACGAEWPLVGGIPRFVNGPSNDCDEINRDEDAKLLQEARTGSWVQTVRAHFGEKHPKLAELLARQRASWAPMLGLDAQSVVLDIGSGYGAVTQSLSHLAGEVYSIEPSPERIEFTRERLRQEGIGNVNLVQASATAMPFAANSFDLVAANDVLSSIGDWDLQGDPRSAQLRFLKRIARLLKDDGVMVLGIRNRFGFDLLMGEADQSGLPYTSLVPRMVANFMLRRSSDIQPEKELAPKKEYRTYTYSAGGYRSLLKEAGFFEPHFYWAVPNCTQPDTLVPLEMQNWVHEKLMDLLHGPGRRPRRSWLRRPPDVLARSRFLPQLLPQFILIASKSPLRKTKLQLWMEVQFQKSGEGLSQSERVSWSLHTHCFSPKSTVRVANANTGRDLAYLKMTIGDPKSTWNSEIEVKNREQIRQQLETEKIEHIRVPKAYGKFQSGEACYRMESAAQGIQLSRVVHRLGYFVDCKKIEDDFTRIFRKIVELSALLQRIEDVRPVPAAWRDIPHGIDNPKLCAAVERARYFSRSSDSSTVTWVQHGDLSVENICVNRESSRIEVFDWDELAGGFPPLYDFFQFFYSISYLAPSEENLRFATTEERWIATFKAVFFGETDFARIVRKLLVQACARMGVSFELIPSLLIEFVLFRIHFYELRSAAQHRVYTRLLEFCIERLSDGASDDIFMPPPSITANNSSQSAIVR